MSDSAAVDKVDMEVDACGLNCPLPILKAKKALTLSTSYSNSGVNYSGSLRLQSAGAVANYFPGPTPFTGAPGCSMTTTAST